MGRWLAAALAVVALVLLAGCDGFASTKGGTLVVRNDWSSPVTSITLDSVRTVSIAKGSSQSLTVPPGTFNVRAEFADGNHAEANAWTFDSAWEYHWALSSANVVIEIPASAWATPASLILINQCASLTIDKLYTVPDGAPQSETYAIDIDIPAGTQATIPVPLGRYTLVVKMSNGSKASLADQYFRSASQSQTWRIQDKYLTP